MRPTTRTTVTTTDRRARIAPPDVHEVARQALSYVVRDRQATDDVMASVLAEIGVRRLLGPRDLRAFGEQLARRDASLRALGLLLVGKSAVLDTVGP
jgi:hypothetical protein